MFSAKRNIRVAILDLYEGQPNEGMRCIREILQQFGALHQLNLVWDEYDVRLRHQVPDTSYDLYISSGGPGSPLDTEGSEWETAYFNWFAAMQAWNADGSRPPKKVFFICHSFQLICRHLQLANVCRRKSTAFGIFPVHLMEAGIGEPVFDGLQDPFYVVDSRDFQVIEPDALRMEKVGASILAIEKERPHVALERAIMAIRFNEHMIGTQFHPEADAVGMTMYLKRDDKKKTIIENHGFEKWQSMIEQLNDPDKILWTYSNVLPNFLQEGVFGNNQLAAQPGRLS